MRNIFSGFFIILIFVTDCLEIWDMFQTSVIGPISGNPFKEIEVTATFISPSKRQTKVNGFYNGNGMYQIRFMVNEIGSWTYFTNSNNPNVEDKTGGFKVSNATGNNRGPVYAVNNNNSRPYFVYANDNGTYFQCGTTSYGWTELSISSNIVENTTNTLKYCKNNNIFNKIRMAVFPLNLHDTHLEPVSFPFTGNKASLWDNFSAFNLTFWNNLDIYLKELQNLNYIIDLIIFHPYDNGKWGFDCMGGNNANIYDVTNDLFYLKYLVARVAAYRNVWWSMGNEYDRVKCKNTGFPNNYSIWDTYFEKLIEYDPYKYPEKEKSIHHDNIMYNYSQPFTTHFSIQGYQNVDYKYVNNKYVVEKPVILDEIQYEGDMNSNQITAYQEVTRFWMGLCLGVYVGHSEGILPPNTTNNGSNSIILWWNYGNILRGESYKKLSFYNAFVGNVTIHPPINKLFTYCYVKAMYNSAHTNGENVTGCYVSQLYDKYKFEYYLVYWGNITNDDSRTNYNYNKTVNIKLNK
eukprot:127050_1